MPPESQAVETDVPDFQRVGRAKHGGKWSHIFDTGQPGDMRYLIVDAVSHREGRIGKDMLDYFFGTSVEWR